MITLENITKFYIEHGKKIYIVKNSSLVIPDKANVAILGKRGSGRTTLLKMLAGIDFPTAGSIASNNTFSWIVGQISGFKKEMTIRQNIKFVGRIYGKSEDEIDEIIIAVHTFSEMGAFLDKPMKECSSAMKQQIAFGLSLAFSFDYLLVDNKLLVATGSDGFREKSKNALREKIKGSNVLMVTNSISDIEELCDACIVIDDETLHYFDDLKKGILFYRQITGFSPPLGQKPVKGVIYCEDGNKFSNIKLAANYYKVNPLSISQAINQNNGSHMYLKKVFWKEGDIMKIFQNWLYIKEETIIASDGIIFKNALEASKFYIKHEPEVEIGKGHVAVVMKEKGGYSESLNVTFNYLSGGE